MDKNKYVWAYGSNSYGQLGNTDNDGSVPLQISERKLSSVVSIAAGANTSFAIDKDGKLFGWGRNDYGNLGDGTDIKRTVPVPIDDVIDVVEVQAGANHTLVRTRTGTVYSMGSGSALLHYQTSPIILFKEQNVMALAAGNDLSLIVDTESYAYGVGYNSYGQLGDGTTQTRDELTRISWIQNGVISALGMEGFEWGELPPLWRNIDNSWEVTTNAAKTGTYAVKVRDHVNDNEAARLGVHVETSAGEVSFAIKTSTEASTDNLIFYIDGEPKADYSGENDWIESAKFNVSAGLHSFEWVYEKDSGTSIGDDTVWIDNIQFPFDSDGDGIEDKIDPTPYTPSP